MNNPLDDIYRQYKQNQNKTRGYGVPNPVGDEEPDYNKVKQCPECKSYNVSIDMSTGKINCNDCSAKEVNPTLIDFSKEVDKMKEEENKKIEDALQRGDTFV